MKSYNSTAKALYFLASSSGKCDGNNCSMEFYPWSFQLGLNCPVHKSVWANSMS